MILIGRFKGREIDVLKMYGPDIKKWTKILQDESERSSEISPVDLHELGNLKGPTKDE